MNCICHNDRKILTEIQVNRPVSSFQHIIIPQLAVPGRIVVFVPVPKISVKREIKSGEGKTRSSSFLVESAWRERTRMIVTRTVWYRGRARRKRPCADVWLVFDDCNDSTYSNITPSFLYYFTLWSRLTSSDALNTRNFPISHCHLVTPRSTLTSADLHLRNEACPSWRHAALNAVVIFVSRQYTHYSVQIQALRYYK